MPFSWRLAVFTSAAFTLVATAMGLWLVAHGFNSDSMSDFAFQLLIFGYLFWVATSLWASMKFNLVKWPILLTLLHCSISAIAFVLINWAAITKQQPQSGPPIA